MTRDVPAEHRAIRDPRALTTDHRWQSSFGQSSRGAYGLDTRACDTPRSTTGDACPSGFRVLARRRSRRGLAAWSRCMTALTTSVKPPDQRPILPILGRATQSPGMRLAEKPHRQPRGGLPVRGGCPGGVYAGQWHRCLCSHQIHCGATSSACLMCLNRSFVRMAGHTGTL
jgi:hypothetical protein